MNKVILFAFRRDAWWKSDLHQLGAKPSPYPKLRCSLQRSDNTNAERAQTIGTGYFERSQYPPLPSSLCQYYRLQLHHRYL